MRLRCRDLSRPGSEQIPTSKMGNTKFLLREEELRSSTPTIPFSVSTFTTPAVSVERGRAIFQKAYGPPGQLIAIICTHSGHGTRPVSRVALLLSALQDHVSGARNARVTCPTFLPSVSPKPSASRGRPVRGLRPGDEEKEATPARQKSERTSAHLFVSISHGVALAPRAPPIVQEKHKNKRATRVVFLLSVRKDHPHKANDLVLLF